MKKRKATAVWEGTLKEGKGKLTTQSAVLTETSYSYKDRFEEGSGTNPEELIAAAHAGCFTMKLSGNLTEAGFNPESLETVGEISLDNGKITHSNLNVKAKVPGIERTKFEELVEDARVNCPISQLLNTEISVTAKLNE